MPEVPATLILSLTKQLEPLPLWAREPAKIVGWIVSLVILLAAGVTELIAEFTDLVPEKYAGTVKAVVAICTVVTVIGHRVQTWLTRNGVGPAGNGKDGVWSEASVAIATQTAIAQAQTPDVVFGAIADKLKPPAEDA